MWIKKIFRKLFKKKDKEEFKIIPPKPKMDFSDIKFEMNIKSICYYEKLTGKSFFNLGDDDVLDMLYSIYMVNNPDKYLKRESFFNLLGREDIAKYFIRKFSMYGDIMQQFIKDEDTKNIPSKDNPEKTIKITDYATTLIIKYGVDAHYVFYEMDVWELNELFEQIDSKLKEDLSQKRFWTYMNIMPHIDTKKCKGPEQLLPFDWEKELIKERKERDLKNNMFAIKNMLGKSLFGNKEVKKDG